MTPFRTEARPHQRVGGLLRSRLQGEWVSIAFVGLGLFLLENMGRKASSDYGDAISVAVLLYLGLTTALWHRRAKLRWVGFLAEQARRVGRRLLRAQDEVGVDFRVTPPVARGFPRRPIRRLLASCALLLLALLLRSHLPEGLRSGVIPYSYVLYLVVLAALWILIGTLIVHAWLALYMVLHDAFLLRGRSSVATRALLVLILVVGLSLQVRAFAPTWLPSALIPALLAVATLVPSDLTVLWRSAREGSSLRAASLFRLGAVRSLSLAMVSLALLLLTQGGEAVGERFSEHSLSVMPLTRLLGSLAGWSAVAGVGAYALGIVRMFLGGVRLTREGSKLPGIAIEGAPAAGERARLHAAANAAGWRIRFDRRDPRGGAARSREIRVPLGDIDFEDGEKLRAWARRIAIAQRRNVVRSLARHFKIADQRAFQSGRGFWIGLQHWFIAGLTRDEDEPESILGLDSLISSCIGPPFDRTVAPAARAHFGAVMRALDVDLIFVEDGVSFRRFRRVLRILFEIFDQYGGKQRAHERFLSGIPGVRVLIHDVDLDGASGSLGYAEPDYENVGRARILHVFKDRGDSFDPTPDPVDRELMPLAGIR